MHISEIPQQIKPPLDEKYKVGEKIKVKVIKVDNEQRKIGLSMK